ncbi:unnamed protein product [Nesidiocoris tenuis]|uniref:Uncharacterized protein n=1 Tax=Nesidiocoris tenuis TaxID=355587 RepID=A0A6H5FZW3_9HEMI|nr:unnamed protein product [Nesidiocoris tenuis]
MCHLFGSVCRRGSCVKFENMSSILSSYGTSAPEKAAKMSSSPIAGHGELNGLHAVWNRRMRKLAHCTFFPAHWLCPSIDNWRVKGLRNCLYLSKDNYSASMERPEIPGQAAEIFDQFCSAGTLKSILNLHRQLCDILHIRPTHINQFYPKLKELAGGQKLVHPITPFPNTSSTSSWELMENGTPSKPFWPTGSGCARGFLSSMDACWAMRSWGLGAHPLEVLAERESIYRLLAQTTPENLQRDLQAYTLDPSLVFSSSCPAIATVFRFATSSLVFE